MGILVAPLVTLVLTLSTGVWPLAPRPEVVGAFSPPMQKWEAGHRGVDLLGRPGQPVHAADDGVVSFAGMLAGRGVVVVVHGDTRTTYEPVGATVRRGDRVRAGQQLGVLETFGSHCWPRACLHWGLLRGETYLDPLSLVGAGPVRLLPLARPTYGPAAPVVRPRGQPGRLVRPGGEPAGMPSAAGPW